MWLRHLIIRTFLANSLVLADHVPSLTYNAYSMITTILTDRTNMTSEVNAIRQIWLRDLLEYLGADVEWLDEAPRDSAVEYFVENDLEIIKHNGIDALEVKYKGEVVGEWGGPMPKMKEDASGDLYFEVEIEHWTIMEEDIGEEG